MLFAKVFFISAEFATSFNEHLQRTLWIAKIGLSENITHISRVISLKDPDIQCIDTLHRSGICTLTRDVFTDVGFKYWRIWDVFILHLRRLYIACQLKTLTPNTWSRPVSNSHIICSSSCWDQLFVVVIVVFSCSFFWFHRWTSLDTSDCITCCMCCIHFPHRTIPILIVTRQ